MTGIEPDEIIDANDWIDGQGGYESFGRHIAHSFAFLGALAYGLSDKDGLRPRPGEFQRKFRTVCKWFAIITLSPFVIALAVTAVIVLINALGGDHNSMWHNVCDWANADGGWCPSKTPS